MKKIRLNIIIILILIILFCYFFAYKENFNVNQCPTTLLKSGDEILLYNPNLAEIPGVNPVKFHDLDDYEKYIQWQRMNKVQCPILKLNKETNTHMYAINSSDVKNTGSLNHNLPCMDYTLSPSINNNLGQNPHLAQNLNLGQNLKSNYEYQYHSQYQY
jgi:hypothetical protein